MTTPAHDDPACPGDQQCWNEGGEYCRCSCHRLGWQSAAQRYLERLGQAEYRAFKATKPGKRAKFSPSEYHRDLVTLLGANDEEGFKARKMLNGRDSVIGV